MLIHRSGLSNLLTLLSYPLFALSQQVSSEPRQNIVKVRSTITVPLTLGLGISAPNFCNSDNTIFIRLASSAGLGDVVSISQDGSVVHHFGSDKIVDITNPRMAQFFSAGRDLYALVNGTSNLRNATVELVKPGGEKEKRVIQAGEARQFIAHFSPDGSYLGAVPLDLPFQAFQFGIFENGDFLVSGITHLRGGEPRVALVRSNGQFHRLLELEGDVTKDSPELKEPNKDRVAHRGLAGVDGAVLFSQIVADGRNLLLFRKGAQAIVFSISPAGDVRPVRLKLPDNYRLFSLRSARDKWIAQYVYRISEVAGVGYATYSVDPATGESLEKYVYPNSLGFGLVCTDGVDFTFLKKAADNTLTLLKATSSHNSSSVEDKETKRQNNSDFGNAGPH